MPIRVSGIEESVLLELIRNLDLRLQSHADELDFRNAGAYVERAQAKFAAGYPLVPVIDDLWLASRCLHERVELHLLKHAVEKLRVRRIEPIELAVLGGQTSVMLAAAEAYAFPLMPVLARTASQVTRNEAAHCSSFFSTERIQGLRDLVGMAAAAYSAALGATVRGADDEAELALNMVRDAARALGVTGAAGEPPPLVRYLRLCRALRLILRSETEPLAGLLRDVVAAHEETLANAAAGDPATWSQPKRAAAWFDTSTGALLALAVLKAVPVDGEALADGALPYRELYEEMRRVDRSEQEAEASAEARAKYEKAVVEMEKAGMVTRSGPAPAGGADEEG